MSSTPHTLDALHSAIAAGARFQYVKFWGHTPNQPTEVGKECFSQWYPSRFVVDGVPFETAEQYMMFKKAQLFGDAEVADQVLRAPSPGAVKALGRTVRGFQDPLWEAERLAIVVAGNVAKFSQSSALRAFLLSTGERVIVEASPVDRIGGIGLSADDPRSDNPLEWCGLNLLGFALMDARHALQSA